MSATWWKTSSKKDVAAEIWQQLDRLDRFQRGRRARDLINERIYMGAVGPAGGRERLGDGAGGFMAADLNFSRTIVDALVARIGNDRPAVHYKPTGETWKDRRRAQKFDNAIEGMTESMMLARKAPLALRDSLMVRGGGLYPYVEGGHLCADRIPCEELYVDEREAMYGEPRQLHRVMCVSKEVLAAKFPDQAGRIMVAPPPKNRGQDDAGLQGGWLESGMTDVALSWHLPSKKDAKDGRRIISLSDAQAPLVDEPYGRRSFPVALIRYSHPRRGYWGNSLIDELAGLQFKVNEVARDLMQNIYFTSSLKVAVRRGAEIAKKKLAGKKPHYIDVDGLGTDVQWIAPDGFSMAQFQFLQWLIGQMFEVSGVSQLMAQGKNPLGAGASGAALNEVYQQDSERFSQTEQAYANLWVDATRLGFEAIKEAAEDEDFRSGELKWTRGGVTRSMAWGEIVDGLEDDEFELQLEPSGFMPSTRAGKMAAIEQLTANGMIDPRWTTSLLDFPDLKRALTVQNAPIEWILWAIDKLVDCELDDDQTEVVLEKSAEIPAPDPHVEMDFAFDVTKAFYQQAQADDYPQPVLDRFLTFMDALDAEKKRAASGAQAPVPDPMAAGMPPGDPMAAPPMDPMAALPPMPMGAA